LAVEETFQNYEHLQSIRNVSPFLYGKVSAYVQQALVDARLVSSIFALSLVSSNSKTAA
jgi:hypothetical protein